MKRLRRRRGHCRGREVTHVLLPATMSARRGDWAELIGNALELKVAGLGQRSNAAMVRLCLRRYVVVGHGPVSNCAPDNGSRPADECVAATAVNGTGVDQEPEPIPIPRRLARTGANVLLLALAGLLAIAAGRQLQRDPLRRRPNWTG